MNKQIDWTQTTLETQIWLMPENAIPLSVGGFLLSVCITPTDVLPTPLDKEGRYRAHFQIIDENTPSGICRPLANIYWQIPNNQCGYAFAVPIVNMNAAWPYYLRCVEPINVPVNVHVIQLNQKY